jgi:hypothetical protein
MVGHHRLAIGVEEHRRHDVGKVPTNFLAISHPKGSPLGLPSRRLSPASCPNEER